MKMKLAPLHKIFLSVLVLLLVTFSFGYSSNFLVKADELSDLNEQIRRKQAEKEATLKKIRDLDYRIKSLGNVKGSLNSQLVTLQNDQTELDAQIVTLDTQIADQEKLLAEFESALKVKEENIQDKINYLYKLSFTRPNTIFSSDADLKKYFDETAGLNVAISVYKKEIKDFYSKIDLAKTAKAQFETDKQTASDTKKALDEQIASVKQQIAAQDAAIAYANKSKATLVLQSNELGNQLSQMSSRQRQLLEAELNRMNSSGQVPQLPLQSGEYYFLGRGRDLIEGHGMGMSQWGAYGMAQAGKNYAQILTFYYTGTTIGDYAEPTQIIVPDKVNNYPPEAKARGYLTIDEYLGGIGEVPNSWPPEAVKAQVVAARTYVMGTCGAKTPCSICGTSACQVYNGVTSADPTGLGKLSAATSTKGKVVLSGGVPIVAYYSASHRGCSSTLSTVWGSADRSYIQSVNDDALAYKNYKSPNPYNPSQLIETYNWKWRTNGYSTAELSNIFSKSPSLNVGTFQRIELIKDVCGRVKNIKIYGSAGVKSMTGWDFRSIFNANTPYADYLYSTEFGFYQN